MTLLAVILLAVLQGLTEFLPVSSSGHLALGGMLMRVPGGDITFEVVVHLGTLVAVLAVYARDLMELLRGVMKRSRDSLKLAGLLAAGSVPAALAGMLLSDTVESLFDDPLLVSLMLIVTGTLLFATKYAGKGKKESPSLFGAVMIGIAQALAILPGISRSGATISTGLFSGIRRDRAARFSFLLSIPAIAGAAVLKMGDLQGCGIPASYLLTGFLVAAVTGYIALKLLLGFLRRGSFHVFSWYCWALGLAGVIITLKAG